MLTSEQAEQCSLVMSGLVRRNLLSGEIDVRDTTADDWRPCLSGDVMDIQIKLWTQAPNLRTNEVRSLLEMWADKRQEHPVVQWLEGLPRWDTIKRAKDVLPKYLRCGGNDPNLMSQVSEAWMLSCVLRLYDAGAPLPVVPFFVGRCPGDGMEALVGRDWLWLDWSIQGRVPPCWVALLMVHNSALSLRRIWSESDVTAGMRPRKRLWTPALWREDRPASLATQSQAFECRAGTPLIGNILQDRDQIWAEAMSMYHAGTRLAMPPRSGPNYWLDDWANTIRGFAERAWAAGRPVKYQDLRQYLGAKHSRQTVKRITNLMQWCLGARRVNDRKQMYRWNEPK